MSSSPSEPSHPSSQDLRLTSLLQLMSNEFTDSVVTRVLSHRSHLPEDVQDRLAAAINREVSVQGFPNFPERALPGMLKPAVISGLRESDSLAGAVLSAWVESHPFLRDAVTEHLCSGSTGWRSCYPSFSVVMLPVLPQPSATYLQLW